jgi:YHS domain-containing protein
MLKVLPKLRHLLVVFICLTAFSPIPIQAQPPTTSGGSGQALLNLHNSVAIHGYDPVAYFTQNQAVPGSRAIVERLGGAAYYFRSRANRYTFLSDASRYQPQFGGFCATSMAMGRLEDINPDIFLIYRGKLYLFRDDAAQDMFLNNPERAIYEATQNFFKIASQRREFY